MNTIVKVPSSKYLQLKTNRILEMEADSRLYATVNNGIEPDEEKGVALFITPGSLHRSGEVYEYVNGAVVKIEYLFDKKTFRTELSDLIIPRGIEDELHLLARQGWRVYLIRTPAIGLGSNQLVIADNNIPVLVCKVDAPEGQKPQQKQKHVTEPSIRKQRNRDS